MDQSKKERSFAAKFAITIAVIVTTAVVSVILQQWLIGKSIVAVTSAVVAVTCISIWRQLWRNAE